MTRIKHDPLLGAPEASTASAAPAPEAPTVAPVPAPEPAPDDAHAAFVAEITSDQFAGKGGSYQRDPVTSKRSLVQ